MASDADGPRDETGPTTDDDPERWTRVPDLPQRDASDLCDFRECDEDWRWGFRDDDGEWIVCFCDAHQDMLGRAWWDARRGDVEAGRVTYRPRPTLAEDAVALR